MHGEMLIRLVVISCDKVAGRNRTPISMKWLVLVVSKEVCFRTPANVPQTCATGTDVTGQGALCQYQVQAL